MCACTGEPIGTAPLAYTADGAMRGLDGWR